MSNQISESSAGYVIRGVEQTAHNVFKAPERIICNVNAARAVAHSLRGSHLGRIAFCGEIAGLIGGSPPYNPDVLREAGLDYVSNFNDMSAHALFQKAALAYWNLTNNVEYTCDFKLNFPSAEAPEFAKFMAKYWDEAINEEWPSFHTNTASTTSQLVKYGVSPIIFSDERDPRWSMVEYAKFYIPDQTQSDLEKLNTVCVDTEFSVQDLWQIYQEFKNKSDTYSDWNIPALGKFLVMYATNSLQDKASHPSDATDLERKVLAGDINYGNLFCDSVRLVTQLQKEYNGDISHTMFHRHYDVENFLFDCGDQYKSMQEAIVLYTMHPGEYTIHENKGLGHIIYSLAQAAIQTNCSIVDMIKWSSTPMIKSSSLNSKDVQQIRFYPGVPTDIGTADFAQNNLGANVQNVVSGAQYIQNLLNYNINSAGNDSSQGDPDQGSLNPDQTKFRAKHEYSVLKNNIMHYYSAKDKHLQLMTAKMLRSQKGWPGHSLAEVWKNKCIDAGVPEIVFKILPKDKDGWKMPSTISVTASRAMGAGSQAAQLAGLQELQPFLGGFNEKEARAYKRDVIVATVGKEMLPRYMNESDVEDSAGGNSSLAVVENAIMEAGKTPGFALNNNHRSHATEHFNLGQQLVQKIQQQGISLVEANSVFEQLLPHLGQHMEALSKDVFAANLFESLRPQFKQLSKYALNNKKNASTEQQAKAEQQAKDAQQTEQVMTDAERKDFVVQKDEARKDEKLGRQNQRQDEQHKTKEKMLIRKTDSDIAVDTAKANAKVSNEKIKAQLTNTADEVPAAQALTDMSNKTISPYDIEGIPKI